MTKAYPYIRFSSEKQKDGMSLQRQTDAINAYLAENPHLIVDTSLVLADLGTSGYSGRHLEKGTSFYEFIEKIRRGEIEKGSVLIIEHFNRLSRLKLNKAMDLFSEILQHGIDIAVLDEKTVFTAESISSIDYIKAVLKFELAHEESKDKSKKGKSNWKIKKEKLRNSENPAIERLNFTKTLPLWLERREDKIVVNEEKGETIKLIFKLCIENNGYMRIAKHLNAQNIKRLDNSTGPWTFDIIKRLLLNRALLGEYQPRKTVDIKNRVRPVYVPNGEEPILGVYPSVVDEDTFNAAQNSLVSRKNKGGGRRSDMPNLFVKLLKCSNCGGSIKYQKTHNGYKQYNYLKCFNSIYGHCFSPFEEKLKITNSPFEEKTSKQAWRYDAFEEMFFRYSGRLNLEDIFKKNDYSIEIQKEITKITTLRNQTKEQQEKISTKLKNLEFSDTLLEMVSDFEQKIKEYDKLIKIKYQELTEFNQEKIDGQISNFKEINKLLLQSTDVEVREKINNHLRALIESIKIDFDLRVCHITFKNKFVRSLHSGGMFGNIPPKSTGEQREKDLELIEKWQVMTEEQRKESHEAAEFNLQSVDENDID